MCSEAICLYKAQKEGYISLKIWSFFKNKTIEYNQKKQSSIVSMTDKEY